MHDLKAGPHHKDRTHKQEVAIAMKQSGQARKKKAPAKPKVTRKGQAAKKKAAAKKTPHGSKRPRNKGRG